MVVRSPEEDHRRGAPFWIGKVCALERFAIPYGEMTMLWYWSRMARESTDAIGEWHQQYANWESRTWEPSKENNEKFLVSSAMTAWTNPTV